jgi:hypothetical protein
MFSAEQDEIERTLEYKAQLSFEERRNESLMSLVTALKNAASEHKYDHVSDYSFRVIKRNSGKTRHNEVVSGTVRVGRKHIAERAENGRRPMDVRKCHVLLLFVVHVHRLVDISQRSLLNPIPCSGFGGRLYPQTSAGQLVTMLYSFIGIPFMLAMTSDLGLVIFDGVSKPGFICMLAFVQLAISSGGDSSNVGWSGFRPKRAAIKWKTSSYNAKPNAPFLSATVCSCPC